MYNNTETPYTTGTTGTNYATGTAGTGGYPYTTGAAYAGGMDGHHTTGTNYATPDIGTAGYAYVPGTRDEVTSRIPYVHGTKGILPAEYAPKAVPHTMPITPTTGNNVTVPIMPTTGTNVTVPRGITIHIHQHDVETDRTETLHVKVPVPQNGEHLHHTLDHAHTLNHPHTGDHHQTGDHHHTLDRDHSLGHPHTEDHHYTGEKHRGEHYNELAYRQKEMVSPDQEPHRAREAQELLRDLQILIKEGDNPSIDLATNLLKRTEDLTIAAANNPDMDADTRKTLDDITTLLLTARLMGKNKGIAERLQIISDETAKAVKEVRRSSSVSESTREYTESLKDFVNNWRPLFYMMTSSRDFRQLIIDVTRVVRHIIYSYTEDLREEASDQFEHGASTREIASTVKEMVKVKGTPEMTEEEFERLEEDLQKILILLAREPNYREGIVRMFSLLDIFQRSLAHKPVESAITPDNVHLRRAVEETEELVASFSGRESLDRFKYYLRHLILQVQKDVTLHTYLHTVKVWLLKARSEDEIREEEFRVQTRKLVYRGRELFHELGNKEDVRPFLDATEDMVDNIKNDEFLQILRKQAGIVQSDLSYVDSAGKLQVDTNMLTKLQSALLPVLADALKYIPIPKINVNNKDMEFWLDNIVLCSYDIMPEHIHFHLESDSDVYMRDIETKSHTYLVIELNKLLTEIKDIEFYFKKKKTPHFEDHGRVTFRLKGDGARLVLTYTVHQDPEDTVPKLREGYASFDISAMTIEFDKSTLKHPKLVPMLTGLFKAQIKHQIEKAVEKNMSGFIQKLGEMMTRNLSDLHKPSFLSGLEHAKQVVKASPMAQVYEKRREKLE